MTCCIALLLFTPSAEPESRILTAPNRVESIEGDWEIEKWIQFGNDQYLRKLRLVIHFSAKTVTFPVNDRKPGKFNIDFSRRPPRIDFVDFLGDEVFGVIELNGDSLTLCWARQRAKRPTTFESRPGSNIILVKCRRIRK